MFQDGSNEGSQHTLIKKLFLNYPQYPLLSVALYYHISSVIALTGQSLFSFQKQSPKSRWVSQDKSRSLRLVRKGKYHIIAKFHRTDLVICSHYREGKPCPIAQ